jgi:hypothetical protein
MRRVIRIAALLLAAGSFPVVAGTAELKPFSATYSFTAYGMLAADAELQLEELPDGRWTYHSQTSRRGLGHVFRRAELSMEQRSVFRLQYGRLIPESFTADDGTANDAKDQDITFDWVAGRVHGVAERKVVDLPTQPGLLDELSVHVALMNALLNGRTPESFVMLDGDRVKEYLYSAEGREQLKTDVGVYDTVIFRSSRPDSRKGTWFWCAPELGYLPVKIERRDGKNVDFSMRLQRIER